MAYYLIEEYHVVSLTRYLTGSTHLNHYQSVTHASCFKRYCSLFHGQPKINLNLFPNEYFHTFLLLTHEHDWCIENHNFHFTFTQLPVDLRSQLKCKKCIYFTHPIDKNSLKTASKLS